MKIRIAVTVAGAVTLFAAGALSAQADEAPDLTVADGIAVANRLDASTGQWAGATAGSIVDVVPYDGAVLVLTTGNEQAVRRAVPRDVAPDVLVVRGGVADAAGSPSVDPDAWSGGDWISGASGVWCTSGFTFRRANGDLVGSTARHCGVTTWGNNGKVVGTTSSRGTGDDDVELIAPAARTAFTHDVWIRGPLLRYVQAAGKNVVGQTIAHYGRTSGGGTGTVTRVEAGGRVYTNDAAVRKGDSGGPVYTVLPSGRAEARGTVSALIYRDDNVNGQYDVTDTVLGMIYTDINRTTADLRVTVNTRDWIVQRLAGIGGTTNPHLLPFR